MTCVCAFVRVFAHVCACVRVGGGHLDIASALHTCYKAQGREKKRPLGSQVDGQNDPVCVIREN